MNTPDKIYIRAYQDINRASTHLDNEWVSKPKPFTNLIEYIRKDALLEWARTLKESVENNEPFNDVKMGFASGISVLIDKINSL